MMHQCGFMNCNKCTMLWVVLVMEQPPCMGASEYIKIFCELSLSFSVNLKLLYKLSDLKIRFITQAYTSCTNSLIKKKNNNSSFTFCFVFLSRRLSQIYVSVLVLIILSMFSYR